ncbi:MAG: hypothetical protein GYA55_04805 [SAR324 cluster bacterium]|uniref:WavE lipopolysaccharide synthesis n=1 Tax=SAR324 cluster bacterium TaxID=2024889 RepID=A0A7X9FRH7_9DELT|nr:hypothetical protein [SAR324 cluster bacterium]
MIANLPNKSDFQAQLLRAAAIDDEDPTQACEQLKTRLAEALQTIESRPLFNHYKINLTALEEFSGRDASKRFHLGSYLAPLFEEEECSLLALQFRKLLSSLSNQDSIDGSGDDLIRIAQRLVSFEKALVFSRELGRFLQDRLGLVFPESHQSYLVEQVKKAACRNRVNSKDISVVVQGPVDPIYTPKCLRSIREHLPGAEIVLSTWEGSAVDGLDFDRIIKNPDPGAVTVPISLPIYVAANLNRQIVSTLNGLKEVSRPYAMKLRSDTVIRDTGFLSQFKQYPMRGDELRVFNERIVSLLPTSPDRSLRSFFMPDFCFFGHYEDLLFLWDIPLGASVDGQEFADIDELVNWFTHRFLCSTEQYIWVNCLRKKHRLPIEHNFQQSAELARLTKLSFVNNFIMLDWKSFGIENLKHPGWKQKPIPYTFEWAMSVTFDEWRSWYKEYCDPDIGLVNTEEILEKKSFLEAYLKSVRSLGLNISAGQGSINHIDEHRNPLSGYFATEFEKIFGFAEEYRRQRLAH